MNGPQVPPGSVIVVADKKGYTDDMMKSEPYLWTYIPPDGTCAPTWYYVKDFPIPIKRGVTDG